MMKSIPIIRFLSVVRFQVFRTPEILSNPFQPLPTKNSPTFIGRELVLTAEAG